MSTISADPGYTGGNPNEWTGAASTARSVPRKVRTLVKPQFTPTLIAPTTKPLRVLIGCEYSGVVRDAFLALGHDAMSCDLLPTEVPGPHYQGDVFDVIGDGWDLAIFHPPCTYLSNSGVRWLHTQPGRWDLMREGAEFFRALLDADIPRIAIENPIPHKYALDIIGQKYTQTIQPYQFGHGETKRTCLWLQGLSPLVATAPVEGREARVHRMPPGPDRWKERSRTYPGIGAAMAAQWGGQA